MYLHKLTLFGFKSFAKKTELTFSKGLSSIVGPNGCGKTNILDSIRWVIGEQKVKALRSSTMQDVIFKGSRERKPMGVAEVQLTLKECKGLLPYDPEADTVTIGRKLYRSGESEYLINNHSVRLKDIASILMGTGIGSSIYALIELSMIQRILAGGKEERRALLEEASGIMKYKVDCRASESKLAATEDDLTRLDDILTEVRKNVNSLKRQMRRSKELEKLRDQIKSLAVNLASIRYTRISAERDRVAKELAAKEEEHAIAQAKRSELEARRQQASLTRDEREAELAKAGEELRKVEAKIAQEEKEHAVLTERIAHAKQAIENALQEVENQSERAEQLKAELTKAENELGEKTKELSLTKDKVDKLVAEQTAAEEQFATIRRENNELRTQLSNAESELAHLTAAIESIQSQYEYITKQQENAKKLCEEAKKNAATKKEELNAAEEELESARKNYNKSLEELATFDKELSELVKQKETISGKINRLDVDISTIEAKIGVLKESSSTQGQDAEILEPLAEEIGILGKLNELVSPKELSAIAMDRVLGELSNAWVIRDSTGAEKVSEKLLDAGADAVLVVLNELPEVGLMHTSPLPVEVKPGAERLLSLFDKFTVGAIGELSLPNENDKQYVLSSDGNYLRSPGIRKIGKPKERTMSFAMEIEELTAKLAKLETEKTNLKEQLDTILAKETESREKYLQIKERTDVARDALNKIENIFRELDFAAKSTKQALEDNIKRLDELETAAKEMAKSREENEKAVEEVNKRTEKLRSDLTERADSEAEAEKAAREISKRATDAQMNYIQARGEVERFEREKARIEMQIKTALDGVKDSERRAEELKEELTLAQEGQSGFGDTIEKLFSDKEKAEEQLEMAAEKTREINDTLRKLDVQLRDAINNVSVLERLVHERSMEKHDQEIQAGFIRDGIRSEYGINIEDVEPPTEMTPEEERKAENKLERLKARVTDFGGVNPEAEAEYEEQKKRLDFLTEQRADLMEASASLKQTIKRLNNTARRLFLQTFEETRRHFREIFTDLFEGGEADIVLTEGEDVLEADIEISARPRGKRFLNIDQLSAGEKSLCALSLLFGLYRVKPSPFCMLDECDAPLDEANVGRFLRMLRHFTKDTQFILITHNKRTMEAADNLYGITMQEDGVSKIISLRMTDLALDFGDEKIMG